MKTKQMKIIEIFKAFKESVKMFKESIRLQSDLEKSMIELKAMANEKVIRKNVEDVLDWYRLESEKRPEPCGGDQDVMSEIIRNAMRGHNMTISICETYRTLKCEFNRIDFHKGRAEDEQDYL